MKKILIVFSLCGLFLTGCENFLDTENLTGKNTGNYPANETDVNDMLTSVYESVGRLEKTTGPYSLWFVSEMLSDDRFAGGGTDDVQWPPLEALAITNREFAEGMWRLPYNAIYRANSVLDAMDGVTWSSDAARDKIEGQTRFLRAYSFFNLARVFGTAQLPLSSIPSNDPLVSADELYAQIALDLKKAIELMPSDKIGNAAERVRATKWAAEAYMARVFLFYTGYYGKSELPLAPEVEGEAAGTVSKDQVVGWLNDCIASSGHKLIDDFRELWPYTNSATNDPANGEAMVYPYAVENKLEWIGQDGANTESVFAIASSPSTSNWGDNSYGNPIVLFGSIRQETNSDAKESEYYPWGWGWGHAPVNTRLWEGWPAGDLRKVASILDVRNPDEIGTYIWGAKNQVDETGYWQKKYIRVMAPDPNDKSKVANYGAALWGSVVSTTMQLGETQDMVMMRFADVLLMHSELTGTADGINTVRARVGLDPVTYSLDNLKAERRYELAFEGLRYHDLLRWGIAEAAQTIIAAEEGVAIKYDNKDAVKHAPANFAQRLQETGGFMPIPGSQIDLSPDVLQQNPGWESLK
ncbi:MAG: RagB/SusD family nutrient uptake outer membrane protein [Rikenellaceae bacterium]|jgi:hypothetical protein|nr:RagB/SusD family nutrient uptake outer membrane protein [Rikenellaceae bacterium]